MISSRSFCLVLMYLRMTKIWAIPAHSGSNHSFICVTSPNFAHFQSSMSFVHLLMVLKFPPIKALILEEFTQMLTNGWIVLLDRDEIIPPIDMDSRTPLSTGFRWHRH